MRPLNRRTFIGSCVGITVVTTGCAAPWMKKEPESELQRKGKSIEAILESEDRPKILGEVAAKIDGLLAPIEYQYFGFVRGLADTGGDTRPSPQREIMLQEMRAEDIANPSEVMKSKASAVVKVRSVCLPGARKGDLVDVLVEISSESEATSIQNGNLLPARLREIAVLNGKTTPGFEKARASGPIVMLPKGFTNKEELDLRTGLILGGARILNDRMLGIRIRDTFAHVSTTKQVARSINERFYLYDRSERRGAATPKDDDFIQIEMHPRYRYDTMHYIDTILSIPFMEKEVDRAERMANLQKMLMEPTTARLAALQLEGIGEKGVEILKSGLSNPDPQIQFYSAYALAYLGDDACVPVLAQLAAVLPDFRSNCFIGLTIIEQATGRDALERLLHNPEPEVRYGAFNAVYRQNPRDSLVSGDPLGGVARFVQIASPAPMVIVSLRDRPEFVVFGQVPTIGLASHVEVNPRLMIRPDNIPGMVRIVRFEPGKEEIAISTDSDLRSVLTGIFRVGGTYSDMVLFIDEASRRGWVSCPVAIDPRPGSERLAERMSKSQRMGDAEMIDAEEAEILVDDELNEKEKAAWWDVRRFFTASTTKEEKE